MWIPPTFSNEIGDVIPPECHFSHMLNVLTSQSAAEIMKFMHVQHLAKRKEALQHGGYSEWEKLKPV